MRKKTKAAVISLRSLGFKPRRNATATSKRKSTEPINAPTIVMPTRLEATSASPMMTLASPPNHHANAHADIREPLILSQQRSS